MSIVSLWFTVAIEDSAAFTAWAGLPFSASAYWGFTRDGGDRSNGG
jgi:hypothetical protein